MDRLQYPSPRARLAVLLTCVIGVSAVATVATAVCMKQYTLACSSWYIDPPDGCPDTVTSTSASSNVAVPTTELSEWGWTSSTPTSCTVDIQKRVPDGEGGCMDGELINHASLNGGSQGSGEACWLSGEGEG